jgi:integrase
VAKTKTLTDVSIRAMRPGSTRREVPDGKNGLYFILQPSGARSFALRFRRDGRPTKFTLGTWFAGDAKEAPEPKVGGALSLAGARALAAETMRQVGRGHNPAAAKRQDKQAKRQAAQDTFEAIATEYLKRECGMKLDAEGNATFDRSKKRSGREQYRMLKRQVFPTLGHRPTSEIKKSDIVRLLDRLADGELKNDEGDLITGGPVAADRALAITRKVLNWHAVRSDDYRPPIVRGMGRVKASERARERVLNDAELRLIWKVSDETAGPFPALVRFLLLSAARRAEAAEMTWSEIEGADWTLPSSRNKTKKDLIRPLSEAALVVLEARTRIEGCDFVFTNDGRRPLTGYSKPKRKFDEAVLAKLRERDLKAKQLPNWTLHDLRRTARSLMSRAGVDTDHAERCLGHIIGGVRGVYDRHEFYDEKKKAYEGLAALIERITNPPPDNVVQFSPSSRR